MNRITLQALTLTALMALPTFVQAQDLNQLREWNMAQDAQFFGWAYRGSWEVARQLPDYVTPSQIIGAMQPYTTESMYGDMNANWWDMQRRQTQAVEGYSRGAIRGEGYFNDYSGNYYQLPWGPEGYHYGNDGYIYEGLGDVDYGQNIYDTGW